MEQLNMLERLNPSRPERVLVIAAHPDDLEFTVAGTISKWAREGTESFYLICTSGEAGSHDLNISPNRLGPIRRTEQQEAAKILGVKEVTFLNYPDGTLQASLDLKRELTGFIRLYKPTAVITWDPMRRYYGSSGFNHPDHIAVGDAAFAAIMPACDSPFIFPELLTQGLEPYKVHEVYLFGSEELNVWIDISETIDLKVSALQCHKSQFGNLIELSDYARFSAQRQGFAHGIQYAESFRYFCLE